MESRRNGPQLSSRHDDDDDGPSAWNALPVFLTVLKPACTHCILLDACSGISAPRSTSTPSAF